MGNSCLVEDGGYMEGSCSLEEGHSVMLASPLEECCSLEVGSSLEEVRSLMEAGSSLKMDAPCWGATPKSRTLKLGYPLRGVFSLEDGFPWRGAAPGRRAAP
jgi:hypothetical protein